MPVITIKYGGRSESKGRLAKNKNSKYCKQTFL
jgi:hypothetical protein